MLHWALNGQSNKCIVHQLCDNDAHIPYLEKYAFDVVLQSSRHSENKLCDSWYCCSGTCSRTPDLDAPNSHVGGGPMKRELEYRITILHDFVNCRRFPDMLWDVCKNKTVFLQVFVENRFLPFAPVDFRRKLKPAPRTQLLSFECCLFTWHHRNADHARCLGPSKRWVSKPTVYRCPQSA